MVYFHSKERDVVYKVHISQIETDAIWGCQQSVIQLTGSNKCMTYQTCKLCHTHENLPRAGHPSTTASRRGAAVYGITVKRLLERGSDNNYFNLL